MTVGLLSQGLTVIMLWNMGVKAVSVAAYTDGGLNPGAEPAAGWGAALCIDPKGKYLLPGSTSDTVRVATGQHACMEGIW